MKSIRIFLIALLPWIGAHAQTPPTTQAVVKEHMGRPMVFINGKPNPLPTYSPAGWAPELYEKATPRFGPHRMGAYFISPPGLFGTDMFWKGDEISAVPLTEDKEAAYKVIDTQAELINKTDPGAYYIVRFGLYEPESWRKLHMDQMFVTEKGDPLQMPSMASDVYWDTVARYSTTIIRAYEGRPWANQIIGYANFHRNEGTFEPPINGWLYDHSEVMTRRWREFLTKRYQTDQALQEAYGDPSLTLAAIKVPKDKLRQGTREVARELYWQEAKANRPLRDYLELQRDLFHQRFRQLCAAMEAGPQRDVIFIYDALKQAMLGWNIVDFFGEDTPSEFASVELMSASGHMEVASLYDSPGFDGLLTPHDYQFRGVGGVFEPEGIVDSTVLRGKVFFCEMDTRSYPDKYKGYGIARNRQEFDAVTWRNLATALTRGFNAYWMDLSGDWFSTPEHHETISRQVQVIKDSVDWKHETVPGIAVILDDRAVLETNGSGNFMNEAIMWEWKLGLARCGVPFRIYLWEDLKLENFPEHRVFYFPNLFKVDDERLAILKEKVLRNGNLVVWGPGSGISDGSTIAPEHAEKLTGFKFGMRYKANFARRTVISNFDHPITSAMNADTLIGGPLGYGPILFPLEGTELGRALTKQGWDANGLSLKEFGRGARGSSANKNANEPLGPGDYAAVFTAAVPLPADLWRGMARYAGTHVYIESNDILLADSTIVALHSLQSGEKCITLPGKFQIQDVITGKVFSKKTDEIRFDLKTPETRVFRLEP